MFLFIHSCALCLRVCFFILVTLLWYGLLLPNYMSLFFTMLSSVSGGSLLVFWSWWDVTGCDW